MTWTSAPTGSREAAGTEAETLLSARVAASVADGRATLKSDMYHIGRPRLSPAAPRQPKARERIDDTTMEDTTTRAPRCEPRPGEDSQFVAPRHEWREKVDDHSLTVLTAADFRAAEIEAEKNASTAGISYHQHCRHCDAIRYTDGWDGRHTYGRCTTNDI